MALTVKSILDMDVAALKAACEEAGLSVKDDRKPTLQEALLSHLHPGSTTNDATATHQDPAAQDLQSYFKLKPETLAALQDGGYVNLEDISLLAQDPTFPANLAFIQLQRDRLAIITHIKKSTDAAALLVSPVPLFDSSHKPSRYKAEFIDLEADDVRNNIVEIRKGKSTSDKDARGIIEAGRQRRHIKRPRERNILESSENPSSSSTETSSDRSRSRSRRRKHHRRSGESHDRVSSHRYKYHLSKHGYDLPRPHHVVKPEALRGKDKKVKPENLTAMEFIYGNIDTAHRLSKKVDGKYAQALQELLEYTGYQVRNFQGYKDETVLLLDDEFRQQAKRDHLSLSDQSARDRLSHFHLNPQNVRKMANLLSSRPGTSTSYGSNSSYPDNQVCWKYNNDRCTRANCAYMHACTTCGDTGHKVYDCPKSSCSAGDIKGPK